jgi:hypothetical protein
LNIVFLEKSGILDRKYSLTPAVISSKATNKNRRPTPSRKVPAEHDYFFDGFLPQEERLLLKRNRQQLVHTQEQNPLEST